MFLKMWKLTEIMYIIWYNHNYVSVNFVSKLKPEFVLLKFVENVEARLVILIHSCSLVFLFQSSILK